MIYHHHHHMNMNIWKQASQTKTSKN